MTGDDDIVVIPKQQEELFREIEKNQSQHIDGKMLANMVRLVFFLALKKSEVINLKIRDVIDSTSNVNKEIQVGVNTLFVSNNSKEVIKKHVSYLSNTPEYVFKLNSLLFQNRSGAEYSESARHLKIFRTNFDQVREAGIKAYYYSLREVRDYEKRYKMTGDFARVQKKVAKGIITGKKIGAGKKRDIYSDLSLASDYIFKINNINRAYVYYATEIVKLRKKLNSLLERVEGEEHINKNLRKILQENIKEFIEGMKISIARNKKMSFSNALSVIIESKVGKDKNEIFRVLLWLIDQIPILPTSDIAEIDRYKTLFFKTLSTLSYYNDLKKDQKFKENFINSFGNNFFEKNVIFCAQSAATYITNEGKTDIRPEDFRAELMESHNVERDRDLLSLLAMFDSNDLKPLVSYLDKKEAASQFYKIEKFYFNDIDYSDYIKDIIDEIQDFYYSQRHLGLRTLTPYREIGCNVADILKINYNKQEKIASIEIKILIKILEYSWERMSSDEKDTLLIGRVSLYEISLIVANAVSKRERGIGLFPKVDSDFAAIINIFERSVGETLGKMFLDPELLNWNPSVTVPCVIHIAMLRQKSISIPEVIPIQKCLSPPIATEPTYGNDDTPPPVSVED